MTTTQTQLRRGTSAQVAAMTPVDGEPVYNTTNDRLHMGDGSTAGGIPHITSNDERQQTFVYATCGGTANAITLTNSPVVASYASPLRLKFKATNTNSGATTVNVDGLGTKNIYKLSGTSLIALTGNEIVSGAIYELNYDGTQFQLGSGAGGGVKTITAQVFTSSGTYTPSAGMLYCIVELVGGGAGGGDASGASVTAAGGGAGGYARAVFSAATIGASKSVTIGAAGVGGTSAGGNGTDGGTTSFGSTLLQATGGVGGNGNSSASVPKDGGVGGVGTLGDINTNGTPGGASTAGGAGGFGGSSFFGGGGRGRISNVGGNGTAYGSGGAGGGAGSDGGNGSDGVVIVTEYCSQ